MALSIEAEVEQLKWVMAALIDKLDRRFPGIADEVDATATQSLQIILEHIQLDPVAKEALDDLQLRTEHKRQIRTGEVGRD